MLSPGNWELKKAVAHDNVAECKKDEGRDGSLVSSWRNVPLRPSREAQRIPAINSRELTPFTAIHSSPYLIFLLWRADPLGPNTTAGHLGRQEMGMKFSRPWRSWRSSNRMRPKEAPGAAGHRRPFCRYHNIRMAVFPSMPGRSKYSASYSMAANQRMEGRR